MQDLVLNAQWFLAETTTTAVEHGGGHGEDHSDHPVLSFMGLMIYTIAIAGIIMILMTLAKKGFKDRVFKGRLLQYFEQLHGFIENLCVGIIGGHGRKYMPMMYTLWLMIFVSNLVALAFPSSPTADLSFNLGIALLAIGYVQWEGMRANGVFGHWKHFAGPKLPIALIPITLMIFVIELISEVMKNVSLSLRLFGNIDGGHQAAVAMNELGKKSDIFLVHYLPFGAFLLPIKMLTCVVQALIFCLLFCVYLSLVTHHDHDEHAEHAHGEEGGAHAHPATI